MIVAEGWKDYELIDSGGGEKLERWGGVRLTRPDPQAIWPRAGSGDLWRGCDLRYHRNKSGGGYWEGQSPPSWDISYENLRFNIRPTDFKHMGLFPEQAVNWRWVMEKIKNANRGWSDASHPARPCGREVRVLNLFGYTGGATLACLAAGAEVTHVDAAKGINQWAKHNIKLSGLEHKKHRVLTDDCVKFVMREARRNSLYDAVIMDPPAYGRGPSGELWKLEDRLYELVSACAGILSEQPLFMLLNIYTTGFSPAVAENILRAVTHNRRGTVSSSEIGIAASTGNVLLPCGFFGRWEA